MAKPVGALTFEQYLSRVEAFHGFPSPGLLIGGYMVEKAKSLMPQGVLYDAISETKSCLPDAVQLLTPCTVGNGWLRVLNLGRYALTLYDKHQGGGVRVWLDADKLEPWDEIRKWFFVLVKKSEQDQAKLVEQIGLAGDSIVSWRPVKVRQIELVKKHKDRIAICPLCREAYPPRDGAICRGCQGETPYEDEIGQPGDDWCVPGLMAVDADQAVGRDLLHDMTRVIPGREKGAAFLKGQRLGRGDLPYLRRMGKDHVYVQDQAGIGPDWVHEDEAARAFAQAMAGQGVGYDPPPREGKLTLTAKSDGLFMLDGPRLEAFNLVPGVMCASRTGFSVVEPGMSLAATRAVPLYLPRRDFFKALSVLGEEPLFSVLALRPLRVGILVTGSEVYQGIIEDRFIPVITAKVARFGCAVVKSLIAPDDRQAIAKAAGELLAAGAELIVTTAGLSVDPDDVTRQGLADCGLADILYGMPMTPGAMNLLGRLGRARVMGVPACALYAKTTGFDVLLPRVLAGLPVTRLDLAKLAEGGLCLGCKTCTYPKCTFGR